jgi:hypothetical protein
MPEMEVGILKGEIRFSLSIQPDKVTGHFAPASDTAEAGEAIRPSL